MRVTACQDKLQPHLLTRLFLFLPLFQSTVGTLRDSFDFSSAFVFPPALSSYLPLPALSLSLSLPCVRQILPLTTWLQSFGRISAFFLLSLPSSLSLQLAWIVCVLTVCVCACVRDTLRLTHTHTHLYTWPTVKIQAKPYKRLSDYVAVKRTVEVVCVKPEGKGIIIIQFTVIQFS